MQVDQHAGGRAPDVAVAIGNVEHLHADVAKRALARTMVGLIEKIAVPFCLRISLTFPMGRELIVTDEMKIIAHESKNNTFYQFKTIAKRFIELTLILSEGSNYRR